MSLHKSLSSFTIRCSLLLLGAHAGFAQTAVPTITSFAGTGVLGFTGDGGAATQAEINVSGGGGLTVDAAGNVYLSDAGNYRVRKISGGNITTVACNGTALDPTMTLPTPGPALQFPCYGPRGIAVATDGSVYFADLGVANVSSSGTLTEDYTNSANDLAIDASGNIYGITNFSAVYKYVPGSPIQIVAGNVNPTQISSGDGGPALSASFTQAVSLAVDSAGNIYVLDSGATAAGTDLIRKFTPGGNISTIAGSSPATPPPTIGPAIGDGGPALQAPLQSTGFNGSIAIDGAGNLYVAEVTNRIRKIDTKGVITTFAGTGSGGRYFGDAGPALQAVIRPQSLAADSQGNLYVLNVTNGEQRILKIAPKSSVSGVPTPVVNAVISAAANLPTITPGGFVSIYGTNFTSMPTRGWQSGDFNGNALPTSLSGVSVTIDGLPAAVSFISPDQLNVVVPDDTTIGPVNVVVINTGVPSAPFSVPMTAETPAFFVLDGKHVIAQHLNYTLVGPTGFAGATPAAAGETIIVYGTGFGVTNPPTPSNSLVQAVAPVAIMPTVTIGGDPAVVSFAGIIGIGLYQLNVTVPSQLTTGDQAIVATVGTVNSQTGASVPIQ